LRGSVKKVIISAPADGTDATFVLGVNQQTYDRREAPCDFECFVHDQLSCPSCQSAARDIRNSQRHHDDDSIPTQNDQKLLDLPHKDLRRAPRSGD